MNEQPILQQSVTGIILAAGFSRRMKKEKLLLPINSLPMIEHVLRAATDSKLTNVLLVYQNRDIAEVGKQYGLRCLHNAQAIDGQSESIKLGVAAAPLETDAYMFLVGDQPFINTEIINRIIAAHSKHPENIIVPRYGEKRATPALFPQTFRAELMALQGDSGGRQIMERKPEKIYEIIMDEKLGGIDIDTPESYRRLTNT